MKFLLFFLFWLPLIAKEDLFQAKAYLLIDVYSQKIILSKNIYSIYPIASITKLFTAQIVRDYFDKNEYIQVPNIKLIYNSLESKANVKVGEEFLFLDLVFALLLPSGNDVARVFEYTLKQRGYPFSKLAKEFLTKNQFLKTQISEPIGLSQNNVSSVNEIWKLLLLYFSDPLMYEILQQEEKIIYSKQKNPLFLKSRNPLPNYKQFFIYGKTGTTKKAGDCFAGFIVNRQAPKQIYGIVFLGAKDLKMELEEFLEYLLKKS
jgi:D-alanyl-D-alanine carboxypeptidase